MAEIPPESVEPPAHQHIELPSLRISEQLVERGPTIFRAAHAAINMLDTRPPASFAVATEFLELVFRFLVEGGYSRVNGGSHSAPQSGAGGTPLRGPQSLLRETGRSAAQAWALGPQLHAFGLKPHPNGAPHLL